MDGCAGAEGRGGKGAEGIEEGETEAKKGGRGKKMDVRGWRGVHPEGFAGCWGSESKPQGARRIGVAISMLHVTACIHPGNREEVNAGAVNRAEGADLKVKNGR